MTTIKSIARPMVVYSYDLTFSIESPTAGLHKITAVPLYWCYVLSIQVLFKSPLYKVQGNLENWFCTCYFNVFSLSNVGLWQSVTVK